MDDGEVILIATDNKNQDGSQTYFILDPCSSEDCVDGPAGLELVDLTDEYQVKNTGAIAVVTTSSTGALEITLKTPKEEMDSNKSMGLSKVDKGTEENGTNADVIDFITDDDTVPVVKTEEEDVDVEEVSIHDNSCVSESKSEPESIIEISEIGEEHKESQNDQDDDTEEGVLLIDDARYNEIQQDELTTQSMQKLNNFNEHLTKQQDGKGQESSLNTDKPDPNDNKQKDYQNVSGKPLDGVSGPISTQLSNKTQVSQMALIHGEFIEIPTEQHKSNDENEKELTDSTNTALTLLELAGSTGAPKEKVIAAIENNESTVRELVQGNSHVQNELDSNETTQLATLQPVQFDPPPGVVLSETPHTAEADTECLTTTPKTPVVRMPPEDLLKRLKDGDVPRQLLGKDSVKRGSPRTYISPLVTCAEITQEFMDRQLQKNPYTDPAGGDYLFAMKLAHRLATKIVPPETASLQSEGGKIETKEDIDSAEVSQNSLLVSDSNSNLNADSARESKKNYAISDKIELLKILEDDPDDPVSSSEASQITFEQKVKADRKKSTNAPLIKMHPELERELALKQLQDFSQASVRRKKKVSFTPNKKIKLEKGLERNNNFNTNRKSNGAKKRESELVAKAQKKVLKECIKSVTADPKQITETLTVEGEVIDDDPSTKDAKSLKQYSNKRFSRNTESPSCHLPMDIVLNGVDDPPSESSSTNKIFKATNPRKRKAELQEKRQKQIANVFHTNRPPKKRGRPPKRKLYPTNDELNREFLKKTSFETNNKDENNKECPNQSSSETEGKPVKTKKMREIERLLGDEGAINMLYSVEQKRASGGESKRGMLPSYRRKKKDLILKTKLVKSAVLRLTTNPPVSVGRVSLRGQTPKEDEVEPSDKNSLRKMSVDSHDSHHSLSSPPPDPFPFPAKIVPAEASRIIRRHSSSSNYSSRSNSPRRQSVDGERINITSPEEKASEADKTDSSFINNSKPKPAKQHTPAESVKKTNEKPERATVEKSKENINKDNPQNIPTSESNKSLSSARGGSKLPEKSESPRLRGRRKLYMNHDTKNRIELNAKNRVQLNTSLAAAVEDFAKENKSGGKNIPVETPKKFTTVPTPKAVYKKSSDTPRTRTPKASKVYKELTLKRHDKTVEISLAPISTKLQNAFNTSVLHELTTVLTGLAKDDNCHVVLITSRGAVFCQGVDFTELVKPTPELRKTAAVEMAVAIKDFVKSMTVLARPVVVAVHGPAVGLGATLLPLCDMVLADENATFHTPYTRLGHVPEGAATLTFPTLLGPSATSELLFACRKFTASEAQQAGLVTRVLPSENFHQEALEVAKSLSSHSAQAMKETKALLRHGLLMGLETTLVSESHLLTKHWVTSECQANFTAALEKGDYVLAAPPAPTLTGSGAQPTVQDGP